MNTVIFYTLLISELSAHIHSQIPIVQIMWLVTVRGKNQSARLTNHYHHLRQFHFSPFTNIPTKNRTEAEVCEGIWVRKDYPKIIIESHSCAICGRLITLKFISRFGYKLIVYDLDKKTYLFGHNTYSSSFRLGILTGWTSKLTKRKFL